MKTIQRQNKSGSALVMVLVVLIIVMGLTTVSLKNSVHLMRVSQRQVWMEQAHFVAESGIEEAARLINRSSYMGGSVSEITHTLGGESAEVVITPINNQGHEFSVRSEATVNGITKVVNLGRIYRPTYLNYGNFYEDFGGYWWIYGEEIDGKIWTGTTQNIMGYNLSNGEKYGPVFTDLNETKANNFGGSPEYASTLKSGVELSERTYDDLQFWGDDYEDGYETGVSKPALLDVDFEQTSTIAGILNADPDTLDPRKVNPASMPKNVTLKLKGKTELRFSVDTVQGVEVGILEIKNDDLFGNYNWNAVYSESIDMVYVEELTGGGRHNPNKGADIILGDTNSSASANILKGNMTIWSEGTITVPNHIIYDNQNLEESTDKLGVIAKDDIWFDRASGDLVIQGGFIATGANGSGSDKGELGLKNYGNGVVRGKLYFLGSMVSEKVSPFGQFSGTRFVSGYSTIHQFDERFLTAPPPFTPVIDSEINYEDYF
ncbi:hypothetical protein P3T73_11740 [Kiritimatiellota bacterium B12222]|nr:hypothetical protein P3T73_11740 [Kiritimatiellota bacterium B12222]